MRYDVYSEMKPERFDTARMREVFTVVRSALTDPVNTYRHLQKRHYRMLPRHEVEAPPSIEDVDACASLLDLPPSEARSAWLELHDDDQFRTELREKLWSTDYGPDKLYVNWRDLLYVLVRLEQPDVVVETGVRGGLSSAYVLNALERNGHGRLLSVDIGDRSLIPPDVDERAVGWMVPDRLDDRWDLHIGTSGELLPDLLSTHDVDLLLSDVPNSVLPRELSLAAEALPADAVVVTCYPAGSEAQTIWERFESTAVDSSIRGTRWSHRGDRSFFAVGRLAETTTRVAPEPVELAGET